MSSSSKPTKPRAGSKPDTEPRPRRRAAPTKKLAASDSSSSDSDAALPPPAKKRRPAKPAPPPDERRQEAPRQGPQDYWAPPPTRTEDGVLVFEGYPDFGPNLTPEEVIRRGSFGATYYRPIHSSVIKADLANDHVIDLPPEWIEGLDPKKTLTSSRYLEGANRFGAKCGQTLEAWEQSGWITPWDPRGWFQWYIRFYRGRRTADDMRQIGRWKACAHAQSGRWLRVFMGKYLKAGKTRMESDPRKEAQSPVVRQVLQHWGVDVTEKMYQEFRAEKGVA
ncbi:hypothetical protein BDK51DRAFT_22876 [Blyttiomyces helicus]|uniref:Uncharacterized protein n=1 Tax=Blyttiomyces helicus TaxID=388810 RepID=A0A4P9W463_9FUNG|nr:hypothetical protein BDK51DRAFT_22876 [Blyttiomyces helicus]|eukprot:RKO86063.1 hypothetical protein BDK51DRAFT_22876 [Blyttiomyces helicus]